MIRSSIKGSVLSNEEVSCASHDDHFLKKVRRALHVWLESLAQKGLAVSGALVS